MGGKMLMKCLRVTNFGKLLDKERGVPIRGGIFWGRGKA